MVGPSAQEYGAQAADSAKRTVRNVRIGQCETRAIETKVSADAEGEAPYDSISPKRNWLALRRCSSTRWPASHKKSQGEAHVDCGECQEIACCAGVGGAPGGPHRRDHRAGDRWRRGRRRGDEVGHRSWQDASPQCLGTTVAEIDGFGAGFPKARSPPNARQRNAPRKRSLGRHRRLRWAGESNR